MSNIKKENNYVYEIGNSLYINITNRCPNRCQFCVRETTEGLADKSLWLAKEPTVIEVIQQITNPNQYDEFVFCGFGEPLSRYDVVVEIAKHLRPLNKTIRINTNGLANLINGKNIVPKLVNLVDVVSISLNAHDAKTYQEACNSVYGLESFPAILDFAKECKKYIPRVIFTVVDSCDIDIKKCESIAQDLNVDFRIRHFNPNL